MDLATPRMDSRAPGQIGLPATAAACLFDLDGVITKTAVVHAAAWQEMFDEFLASRDDLDEQRRRPFDPRSDYDRYVDGKPRYDGVRSFLSSRGITLPEGTAEDSPSCDTICGLGNRKNEIVTHLIATDGVEPYPGSVKYLDAARQANMRIAIVSSSANCRAILESCGLLDDFEVVMDGVVAAEQKIKGKPAPDTYLAAAEQLEVSAAGAVVFEDALAGVESGRAGNFGYVIGVDRVSQREALLASGADVVVDDLEELLQ